MGRLESLASRLSKNKEYIVHRRINQFFYMQKIEEMKILLGQFEEAAQRLEDVRRRIEENYIATYRTWSLDVRWLNNHKGTNQVNRQLNTFHAKPD